MKGDEGAGSASIAMGDGALDLEVGPRAGSMPGKSASSPTAHC